jgi:hypothetical protein
MDRNVISDSRPSSAPANQAAAGGERREVAKLEVELMAAWRIEIIAGRSRCGRPRLKRCRGGIGARDAGAKTINIHNAVAASCALIRRAGLSRIDYFRKFRRYALEVCSEFTSSWIRRQWSSPRRFLMAYGPLHKSPLSSNSIRSAIQSANAEIVAVK